jgi:hypothetical protein
MKALTCQRVRMYVITNQLLIKIVATVQATSRKGKKRARAFEGDEIIRGSVAAICSTEIDGEIILTALEGANVHIYFRILSPSTDVPG